MARSSRLPTRDLREGDGVLVRDNRRDRASSSKVRTLSRLDVESHVSRHEAVRPHDALELPGSVPKPFEGAIPLIYDKRVGYSRPDQIQRNHEWIDRWKVCFRWLATVTADEAVATLLGEPIALAPGSACTQTYFIAGMFDTGEETENYAYYLATKFVRFLVLQRKTTQDVTPDRFRFVPMLDMTARWTDEDLYKRVRPHRRRDRRTSRRRSSRDQSTCRSTPRFPRATCPAATSTSRCRVVDEDDESAT